MDGTSSRTPSPATTNRGWTSCRGERSVSRTSSRRELVRRSLRMRVAGKLTRGILGGGSVRGVRTALVGADVAPRALGALDASRVALRAGIPAGARDAGRAVVDRRASLLERDGLGEAAVV